MEQPVGEDMAALGIGRHLDLVDGEEADGPVQRHGFDGADEIAGPGRQDLLLAGDQRHGAVALDPADAVVVLPGQEAQRKADHPALMAEHALHREIGLARIGRAEDGRQPRPRSADHGPKIGQGGGVCKRLCRYSAGRRLCRLPPTSLPLRSPLDARR